MSVSAINVRFWSKVKMTAPSQCWEWTACRNEKRYGLFAMNGRNHLAHRVAWTIERGPIPSGLIVMHDCDNPSCVNPAHLLTGTHAQNTQDAIRKGRFPQVLSCSVRRARGEANGGAKLRAKEVLIIRNLQGAASAIAQQFGVSATTIKNIRTRKKWARL